MRFWRKYSWEIHLGFFRWNIDSLWQHICWVALRNQSASSSLLVLGRNKSVALTEWGSAVDELGQQNLVACLEILNQRHRNPAYHSEASGKSSGNMTSINEKIVSNLCAYRSGWPRAFGGKTTTRHSDLLTVFCQSEMGKPFFSVNSISVCEPFS